MIVRKLRLQRGWSQDQLAEMCGLSVRTIQRIERGHKASLESAKSLAAVFEVDFHTFYSEDAAMNTPTNNAPQLSSDEQDAMRYAKRVKDFAEGWLVERRLGRKL